MQHVIVTAPLSVQWFLPVCAALPRRQVFALCAAISQTFSAGGLLMSHGAATSSSWGKLFMWLLTQLTLPDRWAKRVWVEALSHPGTNNVSRHTGAGEAAQCCYMTVQLARWCQSLPTAASPNNPVTANYARKMKKIKIKTNKSCTWFPDSIHTLSCHQ